jgi:hypothetical protein
MVVVPATVSVAMRKPLSKVRETTPTETRKESGDSGADEGFYDNSWLDGGANGLREREREAPAKR